MERIKTRGEDGKQSPDYYKDYYIKNKEHIAAKFKERYERIKADPELWKRHQEQCKLATQRYRERHPEREQPQRLAAYLSKRRRVFELLGGGKCRNCGCDQLEFLELNHKNGGGCQDIKRNGNRIYDKLLNGQRDIKDYEVLCRVCNALDHLERKNPEMAAYYKVDYTGRQAVRIDG